ncbi:hypothetical protein RJ41_12260 [Alteromonas marina]|uniref:Uncharacterized protein n=1 Tax=Alteromonas marina TaxID=203795 RepID=A0A0B3XSZ2_9ALTE|nr:hypothetical protein [Alteromonas marina]KHT51395.1 hypothetical protein RJ41_12260 [Alteromonas marina]
MTVTNLIGKSYFKRITSPVVERYTLITVKGKRKLACYIEDEWVIDSTCKAINDMLEQGLIGEEAVKGWADFKKKNVH